ncbi:uncharacterized protein LOC126889531 [Diabrotica virgifera virgifera]|uniref:DNA-directed DNA polymerase n=1 Tax=Diabrotica virgifera virgifera TaxID=50390 RepID=A0ABM5KUH6_DIAVI|nr:uncharacterized protein LOC126889531 [Diabrotica virgifera virgifera]XP_050513838.1 uncharacterized protein LOC126889531 [Diabrotica virgifera virgifera]XP_050513839.1 uncharacterized protein LOC126889531 [Diabrotica virgifera virgifera]
MSGIGELSCDIVQNLIKARDILFQNYTPREANIWLKHIKRHLTLFNKAIRYGDLDVPKLRRLQTNVGHLKTIKVEIQNFSHHVGAGMNKRNKVKWEEVTSSFASRVRTGIIINLAHKDVMQFFGDCFKLFKIRITNILKKFNVIKCNTAFCGKFIRKANQGENSEFKYFSTKNEIIDAGTDLTLWFHSNVIDKLMAKLSEFEEKGSGWALEKIISLEVNINKYEIGNGASSFIKLPDQIRNKNACINVKNNDEACFFWSIVSALYPSKANSDRTSSYPHYTTVLNVDGLETPMTIGGISKFEKQNDISVNVYGLEMNVAKEKTFYVTIPLRLCKIKLARHVNLLMIQDKYFLKLNDYEAPIEDDEIVDIKYHYCMIKNLSRLLSSQTSNHSHKIFVCDRCLNYFSSFDRLNDHAKYCERINDCKVSFPPYQHVKFKNHVYKQTTPFVVYADFEAMLQKIKNGPLKSKTIKHQEHKAFSAGYYVKCSYDESLSFYRSYAGTGCLEWYAKEMADLAMFVNGKIKHIVPMNIKPNTNGATDCHICEKPFVEEDVVVKDHCHFTGAFRGFAHQVCNLNFRKQFVVPIFFHNLSGYDSHFMIRQLAKKGSISLLPINKERYISFTLNDTQSAVKLRFVDSLRFLNSSLDKLATTLNTEDLRYLAREFPNAAPEQIELLRRKGIFPYEYIDSMDRLKETQLPSIDKFYSSLTNESISKDMYQHAQNVWQSFDIKNILEYSLLYMKTDIMLLTCIFENFRQKCRGTYGLDPAWYFTMPGFSWDAMLKYTGCKLELLQDIDKIMFIEKSIRGGISQVSNRYSEANNKYMPSYDSSKPSKYVVYLDVNNLYGWAMSQCLPYAKFEWVDTNIDVLSIPDDGDTGYILQVDLEYPEHLHDLHKDFPFCCEHQVPSGSKFKKLMTTLHNKTEYTLHYRNLKQALNAGLKLTKIHKVLKFQQSAWLKPYIDLNTKLRTAATTAFEKDLYKLANNAIFGKTMENIRKHRIVKLVSKWEGRYGAKNLISSPRFHNRTIFDENLMAIELNKTNLTFNKPLYIGMSILDISKVCMYDFHYNFMLPTVGIENLKLMYGDTDSFIYEVTCDDVYRDVIQTNLSKFDTSDYAEDNPYNIPQVNKKVLGLMKDEANGRIITHFVGLRSKMYSFKLQYTNEERQTLWQKYKNTMDDAAIEKIVNNLGVTKKSKGVKYSVVKNSITFEDYVECLKEFTTKSVTQSTFRSYAHNMFTITQEKIALSPYDDKRCLQKDSYDTLPWGHYATTMIE